MLCACPCACVCVYVCSPLSFPKLTPISFLDFQFFTMSQAEPTTYIGSPSHMRSPFKAITKKVNAKKVVPSSNLSKPLKSKQKIEKRKKERAQKAKQAKKTQATVKAATKPTSKTTPKKKVVKAPALDPVHIVTSAAIVSSFSLVLLRFFFLVRPTIFFL